MLTSTMRGSLRYTEMPMRPYSPSGRPLPVSFVHVAPASVLFHNALPGPPPLNPKALTALISSGVEHARIVPVHGDVGGAGVVIDMQCALPRPAAIHRPIEAALTAGSPHRSLRGDVRDRGI